MAQNINLNSRARKARADTFSARGVATIVAALLIGFGLLGWVESRRASALHAQSVGDRAEGERLQRMLRQLPASAAQSEQLLAEERDVAGLEAVSSRLTAGVLGRAGSFTDSLKGLGRATTEGIWLTGIKLNQGSGRVTLEGKALDAAHVPTLMAALGKQPQFAGTAFAALDIKRDDSRADEPVVRFRITSTDMQAAPLPAAVGARTEPIANPSAESAAAKTGAAINAARARSKP